MGELFDIRIRCHFEDDSATVKTFDVAIISDLKRFTTTSEYFTDKQIVNNQASSGQKYFRQDLSSIMQEGFEGKFFQLEIDKIIPTDGRFDYNGFMMHVIPRPQIDAEFLMGGKDISNGW
jgi:hypothetical protein